MVLSACRSCRFAFRRLPMRPELFVELLPPLLRKEDSGPFEFDTAARARDSFSQPARPFHVKEDIVGSPHDECRRLERFQARFDGARVLIVEGREKSLKIARGLLGPDQRLQVLLDALIAHLLRMLVGWPESLRRPIDPLILEH